jgi:hypothetical protein
VKHDDIDPDDLPVAPKRSRGFGGKEKKAIGNELAAMAYVAMENGAYQYGKRSQRVYDKTGEQTINKKELMRLAGYSEGSLEDFDRTLGRANNEEFWQLVELYRIRRTDPMFRKEQQKEIIGEIAAKLSHEIYEALFYYPHSITFRDKLQALKTIVDLGYRVSPERSGREEKSNKLLDSLPADQRQQAIAGLKAKLQDDLASIDALEAAHKGADKHG